MTLDVSSGGENHHAPSLPCVGSRQSNHTLRGRGGAGGGMMARGGRARDGRTPVQGRARGPQNAHRPRPPHALAALLLVVPLALVLARRERPCGGRWARGRERGAGRGAGPLRGRTRVRRGEGRGRGEEGCLGGHCVLRVSRVCAGGSCALRRRDAQSSRRVLPCVGERSCKRVLHSTLGRSPCVGERSSIAVWCTSPPPVRHADAPPLRTDL